MTSTTTSPVPSTIASTTGIATRLLCSPPTKSATPQQHAAARESRTGVIRRHALKAADPGPAALRRGRDGARWPVHALRARSRYLSDVKFRSQLVEYSLTTPRTLDDSTVGTLSQMKGIAGACSVTILSISPHALLRSAPAGSAAALAIASLMAGTFSCDQFELF